MDSDLQQKLFDKYPKIFADKDKSPRETLICFGIETGNGWYWLLDNLCNSIQEYIDNNDKSQVRATQVKEKYGTLRFYVDHSDQLIDGMIWLAECLSGATCEQCGATESIGRTSGWVKTLCKICAEKNSKTEQWKELED